MIRTQRAGTTLKARLTAKKVGLCPTNGGVLTDSYVGAARASPELGFHQIPSKGTDYQGWPSTQRALTGPHVADVRVNALVDRAAGLGR